MCQRCLKLTRPVKLQETEEFFSLAEQLAEYVGESLIEVTRASSPFEELRRDQPLKEKYFFQFRCTRCYRDFQLSMDTASGAGRWF
jgi:hypothetical protein